MPTHGRTTLGLLATAQLVIVLDATIVNVALPRMQDDLLIPVADRSWVVTAYTLAFGGLLLLGGRIVDGWGVRRTFCVGLGGFAAASALGGLAPDAVTLFLARGLQGAFAALLAPATLALLSTTFTAARERATAFAVFGAVAAGGGAIGVTLGGVLTEFAGWRWCLLVNVPIAAVLVAVAVRAVPPDDPPGTSGRPDVLGAALAALGLGLLVLGITTAAETGWGATTTVAGIAAGVALLAVFVLVERRVAAPLLPLRLVLDRDRGGAYLFAALLGAIVTGTAFFLTVAVQQVLGYSPLQAGLALLPFTVGVFATSFAADRLARAVGPRLTLVAGSLVAAAGLLLLARFGAEASFVGLLLPGQVVVGLGLGLCFSTSAALGLARVPPGDTGTAGALVNVGQQVGASLGAALLNTVVAGALAGAATVTASAAAYAGAFGWTAALAVVAAAVALVVLRPRPPAAARGQRPGRDPAPRVGG